MPVSDWFRFFRYRTGLGKGIFFLFIPVPNWHGIPASLAGMPGKKL
jgi:hypothetical protein